MSDYDKNLITGHKKIHVGHDLKMVKPTTNLISKLAKFFFLIQSKDFTFISGAVKKV